MYRVRVLENVHLLFIFNQQLFNNLKVQKYAKTVGTKA
jgi:hypothetical protein